ncbi:transporter protein smf2 [Rhizodiscina lignyota]|uniref:Transporter protein smf2 n=1 Tax=Rhizodiscina lignyota TaxID=1504668 RepID=A0A9P4MAJ4_9PEZI|nr:transporter protein smf2 [Rhizodiscina lignyota]
MNCPSRVDADLLNDGHNQNPPALAADLTTNSDLNHIANSRRQRGHKLDDEDPSITDRIPSELSDTVKVPSHGDGGAEGGREGGDQKSQALGDDVEISRASTPKPDDHRSSSGDSNRGFGAYCTTSFDNARRVWRQFRRFLGPGVLISCAYIDPGNYATDVAAGASYRFKLLFVILMANVFAIFLQSLCAKLGSVTGKNLPEMCREHLPPWLNYVLYFFNEVAIVATDIAEVIGFAIALNLLSQNTIPLAAGCAISIVSVMFILFFYKPSGTMKAIRVFEAGVALLVFGVVVCFCIQLSLIKGTNVGEVFKGYLPSSALIQKKGLYQACGILGATVMPHSLFLGSGLVQSRLRDFDVREGIVPATDEVDEKDTRSMPNHQPSLAAIRACLPYSIAELALSLFSFALFVNSAILIVAGAALYGTPGADDADIFGIYNLLSSSIGKAAGIIFALALLLSGTSAGIVCTMAGQMVSEGQLNWKMQPWMRRLITRTISIIPSIIIAGAVGREGLSTALVASQVILSCLLPIVSAPLIYFTCRAKYMTVGEERVGPGERSELRPLGNVAAAAEDNTSVMQGVSLKNSWITTTAAGIIWAIITLMNVAAIVLLIIGGN